MKEKKKLSPGLVTLALLVLLVSIFFGVVMRGPRPATPQERLETLRAHQAGLYFIDGEVMAKRLAGAGYHRWSRFLETPDSNCEYLGNDVWHASGWVEMPENGAAQAQKWETYFSGGAATPLFARVGSASEGNYVAALDRAGVSAP